MKEVEDARWREAAAALGLALVRDDGKRVTAKRGTRRHRMEGMVDGREVTVRHALHQRGDALTVVTVRLCRPLLLGLSAQASAPPRTGRGVSLGGGLRTTLEAIEPPRARAMFETQAGLKAMAQMRWLGAHGWVELRDTELRMDCDVMMPQAASYVKLVRAAVEVVTCAEAARQELAPSPWESALSADLQTIAADLQIAFDPLQFKVVGRARDATIELGLDVGTGYALSFRVGLRQALPEGSRVSRRTGFWSRVAAFLRLDRPTQDAAFNAAFEATPPIRSRLTPEVARRIVAFAPDCELAIDEHRVTHRTPARDASAAQTLARIVDLVDALAGRPAATAYRGGGGG